MGITAMMADAEKRGDEGALRELLEKKRNVLDGLEEQIRQVRLTMSEDMGSSIKAFEFGGTKRFLPYDEGQETGDFYLMLAPAGEEQAAFYDDMDLFDIDKGEGGLLPGDKYAEGFEDGLESPTTKSCRTPSSITSKKWAV